MERGERRHKKSLFNVHRELTKAKREGEGICYKKAMQVGRCRVWLNCQRCDNVRVWVCVFGFCKNE